MSRTTWLALAPLILVLTACFGGDDDDDGPSFDAPPGSVDGPAGTPDSAPIGPDAAPQTFNITFADTCPAFTPCGGTLTGTWFYTGICVTYAELIGQAGSACPSATASGGSGTASGVVYFSGSTVTRRLTGSASGTVKVPAACVGGQTCATVQSLLATLGLSGTCATDGSGGCDCSVTSPLNIDQTAAVYTVSGNNLITGTPSHTYGFCVSGTTLQYKDTTASQAEFGVATLQKQ